MAFAKSFISNFLRSKIEKKRLIDLRVVILRDDRGEGIAGIIAVWGVVIIFALVFGQCWCTTV